MLLIPIEKIVEEVTKYNVLITGVIHFGAETCDELETYKKVVYEKNIVWVEALQDKVDEAVARGVKQVHKAVICDTVGERPFYRANNVGSSSILEFGTHKLIYPGIHFESQSIEQTTTIDVFVKEKNLNMAKLNMWVLNVGGAEILALKGAERAFQYADVIYTKVHADQLYVGCATINEMDAFMATKNFGRGLTATTQANWGDAVYIRKPVVLPQVN